MKKQHTLALLLMAGLTLGSCSSDDSTVVEKPTPQPTNEVKTYHATTVANMGENGTRTLTLEGTTLNVGWATTENVYVLVEDDASTGNMNPTIIDGTAATLVGDLTGTFAIGDDVTLRFPRANKAYFEQQGTLADIAENFDYAELTTEVESVNGDNITINGGTLESQQAIVKFTFNQSVDRFSIVSDILSDAVTVAAASAGTEFYVALPISESKGTTFYFTARNGNTWYQGSKTVAVSMQNGKYYTANVSLSSVTAPALGDLYYSDGTWSSTLDGSKTPVGVIVYLNESDYHFTEMGLVMCLKYIENVKYSSEDDKNNIEYPGNHVPEDAILNTSDANRSWVCGYAVTKAIAEKSGASTAYPALYQAWNYTDLTSPTSSTGWFLPDVEQWGKCLSGLGGYTTANLTAKFRVSDTNALAIAGNLNAAMEKAGTSGTDYNPMGTSWYSSVTRLTDNNDNANFYYIVFSDNEVYCETGDKGEDDYYVRPFLAF